MICFKGKGKRIKPCEIKDYDKDVIVQWDPNCKAWYNERMCMEWARLAAVEIVLKSEGARERRIS